MILFSDRGCPSAHRVRALLAHLELPVELLEAPVGQKPPGVRAHIRGGQLPVLVDGELVLTESRVMLEHLAERSAYTAAYPTDLAARSRHRRAMAIVDDYLGPALFAAPEAMDDGARFEDALDALEQAASELPGAPCLFAFHVAPFWFRYARYRPRHAFTRAVPSRPGLHAFLDAAAALPSVRRTAPNPEQHAEDLRQARASGLIHIDPQPPDPRTP